MAFILLCDLGKHGGLLKLEKWKMISLKYFRLLWSASSRFSAGAGADQIVLCKNNDSMCYICVSNSFSFALESRSAWGSVQAYDKCSILCILRGLGPFPQVLGQVKEWLILELCKMIKLPHIVRAQWFFFF